MFKERFHESIQNVLLSNIPKIIYTTIPLRKLICSRKYVLFSSYEYRTNRTINN